MIVQGITGRMGRTHAALMRAYGTNIVGGTSTRTDIPEAAGVPVFATCRDAVLATGAVASVRDGAAAGNAGRGGGSARRRHPAYRHGAEGVPLHDAVRIGRAVRRAGATWIGASTPGMAIPGEIKLGFLPDVCLRPGPFAIMSKSGTLSYEVGYRLALERLGQSIWVGVGGDPVKGVRFADLLPVFFADPRTHAICWSARSAAARKRNAPMPCSSRRSQAALRADRRTRGEGGRVDGPCRRAGDGRCRNARIENATPHRRRRAGVRLDRNPDACLRRRLRGAAHMKLLDGVRVLDLTNVIAGPLASYQLASLGAEVIKVEVPGLGDLSRKMGADPELGKRQMGASFLAMNAGKKSITLNL